MILQALIIIPPFNIVTLAGNILTDAPGQNLAISGTIAFEDCSSERTFQNARAILDDPPAQPRLVRHAGTPDAPVARNTRSDNAKASKVLLPAGDGWKTKDPS